LRDIEVTLGANANKLYAMALRHSIHRSTLADANESRDRRIWSELAAVLVRRARKLYRDEDLGLDLSNTVYALDATTIDLCLSLFDWAPFRSTKAAVKCIPCWICAAPFRASSTSATASCTRSMCSTSCPSPVVPLPGMFVDALTGPLKQEVSRISEAIVYAAGYPIGRDGVMIAIGNYQLLVAEACSGLHTMFSLSALGLLFMYMTARTSLLHNAIMLASIILIAFVANIVRVLVLILITYHFGDEAGQGFLHGTAGIVLLMVALPALFALDAILARVINPRKMVA
jgi:exosortase/archaeosortase family protein